MLDGIFILKIMLLILVLNISICTYIYALSPQDELIYQGIDISSWQRNINFKKVKNAGIEVVYIKASEGNRSKDPYLEQNYKNAKANNLKIGFYHYVTAKSVSEAQRQADFFASVIKGKEVDCKLAMDYENFFGESKKEINKIAVAFIKRLKKVTGKDVIVYSNVNNIKNTFKDAVANEGKLWVAYYSNSDDLIHVKSSWNTYIGIQYTSTGRVPGIKGNVDRDRFSKEILLKNDESSGNGGNTNSNKNINYIVNTGDTLSKIAKKYKTTVREIAKINNIKNVNLIFPGQVLQIMVNSKEEQNSTNNRVTYVIKKGDTLWAISKKYGVSIQNLVKWNNIKNPNLIYIGNKINIYINTLTSGSSIIQYSVRRGDTLWNIARNYGTTVRRIVINNNIKNPNLIYPGQVLKIF